MARNPEDKTVRIAKGLAARATLNAESIGWSFNQFCENAVKILCDMADDPQKRIVPDVILQIEALRGPREVLSYGGHQIPVNPAMRAAQQAGGTKKRAS